MELNKNKIIFWAIWVILLTFILLIFLNLNNKGSNIVDTSWTNTLTVWTVWDDSQNTVDFINDFKSKTMSKL